jgi:rRNA maturation RNase YbeY
VSGTLTLRNRHPTRRVDLRFLRRIALALLRDTQPSGTYDLGLYLVAAPEMTRLNEAFLRHQGSTDVITFNYSERVGQASRLSGSRAQAGRARDRRDACPALLHGEILICLDEAASQARRFRTTWQSELVRYVVHGVLHLLGYDDQNRPARRRMRAAENRLHRRLSRQFVFRALQAPLPLSPP